MKLLIVAVFISCIAAVICKSEEDAEFKEITDGCAKEVGVPADAWDKIDEKSVNPKLPDFLFCIYKKIDFLNDKGEYQIEQIKEALTEDYSEEVATKFIEKCTKETYASGPETALHMANCEDGIIPEDK